MLLPSYSKITPMEILKVFIVGMSPEMSISISSSSMIYLIAMRTRHL